MRTLWLALLLLPLAGCTGGGVDRCADRDGASLFVSADAPTDEPALFFIVELLRDGEQEDEREVPVSGCVAFEPQQRGEYEVTAIYWVEGTDCAHTARETVDWRGERVGVALDDYARACE